MIEIKEILSLKNYKSELLKVLNRAVLVSDTIQLSALHQSSLLVPTASLRWSAQVVIYLCIKLEG